ncbi:MAG TPA: ThiF family adenylyltransferase [Aquificae bacterium]|nr:ThiF family adenylyltransferase [Aquificota bacterium]
MFDKYYKIRESIDIYTLDEKDNLCKIEFYRINTRERKAIKADRIVLDILAELDGKKTLEEISTILNIDKKSLEKFIKFLLQNGYLIESAQNEDIDDRFIRQISFFDDLVPNSRGVDAQKKLSEKKIVIFGVGSVGGDIAILLARAGIKNFVFVDYKKLKKSHIEKHLYCNKTNIGKHKTEALKEHIKRIDKTINIKCINEKLIPYTNLDAIIDKDVSLVINCADEPYIGYTSIKIGRYLWKRGIAMFVGGGFDAHSMSTGEFIIPNKTACIDCHINSFKKALKDWKPTYNTNRFKTIDDYKYYKNSDYVEIMDYDDIIVGGPGSIAQCSLFSASYASMLIIFYLIGMEDIQSKRGEYLINKGVFSWIDFTKEECEICKR